MRILPQIQMWNGARCAALSIVLCAVILAGCKSGDSQSGGGDDSGRTADESYGFSLSAGGELLFTAVEEDSGYTAEPSTVSITNTGAVQTGLIRLALSGSGADKFTLTPSSIENIPVGESRPFLLTTVEDLPEGDYVATLTASGPDNFSRSFTVKFNVYIPTVVPVTVSEIHANGTLQTVTTTEISFKLDPPIADLTIDNVSLNDRGTGAQAEAVRAGTEDATWVVTVSGITQQGNVTVNLTKRQYSFSGSNTVAVHFRFSYGLNVVSGGTLNFETKIVGYTAAPAGQSVTVVNTGNQPLSGVAVNPGANFTASPAAADLAIGASASFTVQPKTTLVVGTYSPQLTVGTASATATFNPSFTVRNGEITGTVANATVTASPISAAAGTEVTVTVTPNDNYALKPSTLALSPTAATFTRVNATQYKFIMPANADMTVTAQVIKPGDFNMATGGTITMAKKAAGDYEEVHVFLATGTLKANRAVASSKVTLVAGGGGGGGASKTTDDYGGGGGAGGVLRDQTAALASGSSYGVTIGAGGAGGTSSNSVGTQGTKGGNTIFKKADGNAWFTANGGGGGGAGNDGDNMHGIGGGSGGGGAQGPSDKVGNGGTGSQGKSGGKPGTSSVGQGAAGGGGFNGAGGANSGATGGLGGTGIMLTELTNAGWSVASATVSAGGRGGYNSAPAVGANYGNGGGGGGNPITGAAGKGGLLVVTFPWVSP